VGRRVFGLEGGFCKELKKGKRKRERESEKVRGNENC